MSPTVKQQEFKIVIQGAPLPKATADKFQRVLQQSVLSQLASVDVNVHDYVFRRPPDFWGIIAKKLTPAEFKRLGLPG